MEGGSVNSIGMSSKHQEKCNEGGHGKKRRRGPNRVGEESSFFGVLPDHNCDRV